MARDSGKALPVEIVLRNFANVFSSLLKRLCLGFPVRFAIGGAEQRKDYSWPRSTRAGAR